MLVATGGGVKHVAHVGARAGNAQDAAFLVQDLVHLVERLAFAAHDVGEDGRVDVARTRAHHQTLERREAHGGVDGLAVVDGRDRTAVAQVARDEAEVAQRAAEQVGCLLGSVAVRRAMRAVTANMVVLVVAHRQRVHVGLRRHGRVECGVEDGYLRRVGHELVQHVDAGVGSRVVQRCQFLALIQVGARFLIDECSLGEVFAAGDDAVADGFDLTKATDGRLGVVGHDVEQLAQALGDRQVGNVVRDLLEIGGERDAHAGFVGADLLGQAFHAGIFALGFDKLRLEARRASVDDEYEHDGSSLWFSPSIVIEWDERGRVVVCLRCSGTPFPGSTVPFCCRSVQKENDLELLSHAPFCTRV